MERGNIGRQLAFGVGVHRCIGASLARMEIKVAARELVRRVKDLKITIPLEDIPFLPSVATQTMSKLPISFKRR